MKQMNKFICDRCKIEIGSSQSKTGYYDVRTPEISRYSHKGEKYVCEKCIHTDPRYIADNDKLAFSKTNE